MVENISEIKEYLLQACKDYVNQRIDNIQGAIISARQSAGEETKSSAGDKYETGRAMMHLEIENQTAQLNQAQRLAREVMQIKLKSCEHAQPGSLVITDQGNYFIAIGAGKIEFKGKDYFAIGLSSPIGRQLNGSTPGSTIRVNGRDISIQNIY